MAQNPQNWQYNALNGQPSAPNQYNPMINGNGSNYSSRTASPAQPMVPPMVKAPPGVSNLAVGMQQMSLKQAPMPQMNNNVPINGNLAPHLPNGAHNGSQKPPTPQNFNLGLPRPQQQQQTGMQPQMYPQVPPQQSGAPPLQLGQPPMRTQAPQLQSPLMAQRPMQPQIPQGPAQRPMYPAQTQQQQQFGMPPAQQFPPQQNFAQRPQVQSPLLQQPQLTPSQFNGVSDPTGKLQYQNQSPQQQQQQQYQSVARQGFNQLWGHDTLDLMQNRRVLPSTKVEPPHIKLNHQFHEAVNCNPE